MKSGISGAWPREEGGMLRFPALIDCHVHFREPGLTHKADMASEAVSAVSGGVRTACEMPNTVPPTVTIAALADKVRRAAGIPGFDFRFFFGITQAAHLHAFAELLDSTAADPRRLRERCCGIKLYLDHSTGDQKVEDELLDSIFALCARHDVVAVCHCEDPATNERAAQAHPGGDVSLHSLRRPPEAEAMAIRRAIDLARTHGTRLHVAHLSTAAGVEMVRDAKKAGVTVTCEVAPHHLFLTTDDYASLGTLGKMNPPLRSREHRDALWAGVMDGTVDCVATDHAPHTLEEKRSGDPLKAPSGVPGVETMLPLLLTVAAGGWPHPSGQRSAVSGRFGYDDIVRLCFENPNRIFKLGKDGSDTIVVDPEAEWTIRGADLHAKCGWTPFEGWKVTGKVIANRPASGTPLE
jgi:dihydroorotase